ncbi:unnamed protein product [Mytilus edulis]|uniref:DZIP3-like HEPN domain-containing protein n=1 Tax=Mytilus edulis TaxID=6550 RepID=A0A8S3TPC0_MYTED|nr:unnamed protein product [Mytilus edulis]
MMAPLSEEEENYVRLALLLKGVAPRAIRTYFDRTFPPTYLPSTLNTHYDTLDNLKFRRVLNQTQWNLLFPTNGVPDSTTFDVTLMICLIRNLTSIIQPINGFDRLPLPVETTPGADLARIKWYRNILAHHDSNKIATADFNTAWSNISDAVSRLGGQPMNQECQELKVNSLDHNQIPRNIRGQIKEELEIWAEDDKMFIETNGAKRVSPLFIACFNGHTKTVELLLKNDADVNLKWEGLTPLDIARRENHCNIVHVLQKTK